MTKKDDLLAALQNQQPLGAVPLWEIEFQAWDAISGRHLVTGNEFAALPAGQQERVLHENAELLLSTCEELHYAALSVPNGYWEVSPGVPAYYWLPPAARWQQIAILQWMAPPDLLLVGNAGGVMAMPGAEQYVEFAYRLYDAPQEIEALAEATLRGGLETAHRMRDLGIQIVMTASDIADNHGVYFKPRHLERFVLPYLRRWAAEVRQMGMYSILHSDGNLNACLDALADSGIDALQAIDPTAGMDLLETKQKVNGRICLCGNIDCGLLLTATPEAVYDTTAAALTACKPGGGLVLGASNAVQPDVPPENYRAMLRAWQDFGGY